MSDMWCDKKGEQVSIARRTGFNSNTEFDSDIIFKPSDEAKICLTCDKKECRPTNCQRWLEARKKIKGEKNMTPLFKKYMQIQNENPDCIVLVILGDFYECLGEKAKQVAEILNLTLTGRYTGLNEHTRTPLCGFPYSCNNYIEKLREYSDVIVFDSEHNSITRSGKIKGKREQIEQFGRDIRVALEQGDFSHLSLCDHDRFLKGRTYIATAEALYNAGYQKIPENAVVLTEEEIKEDIYTGAVFMICEEDGKKYIEYEDHKEYTDRLGKRIQQLKARIELLTEECNRYKQQCLQKYGVEVEE